MATRKYPPSSGKSSAAKFGEYMNAKDVKGNPKQQSAAIKKRADDLKKAFFSPMYPAKPKATNASEGPKKGSVAAARKAAGSEGPKKSGSVPTKRPVRGGGSLQGDLAKFGAAVRKNAAITKRKQAATSTKAKQMTNRMSKGY